MKIILFIFAAIIMLSASGCIVADDHGHGDWEHHDHDDHEHGDHEHEEHH
jgi:hypothetical protein